jgi:hypothetical protein
MGGAMEMTKSEEWKSVQSAASRMPSVDTLQAEQLQGAAQMVTSKFLVDSSSSWWWTKLKASPRVVAYSGGEEFFPMLRRLVPEVTQAILLVMNESGPPVGAIQGAFGDLVSVIEDSMFFEFIITPPSGDWAIFDTHHNELLIAGEI